MRSTLALATLSLLFTGCSGADQQGDASAAPANGPDIALALVADGLEFPWGMAFLPNGDLLVTEREGRLRIIRDGVLDPAEIQGTPEPYVENQGGYLGLAVDPDFSENRTLYMAFSKGDADANNTAVLKGRLSDDGSTLQDPEVIFEANAVKKRGLHFGGRLAFLPDGSLLVTLGDGFMHMDDAQNKANHFGKIVRIMPDGSVPNDNPFVNDPLAAPEIYSMGHRNVQGIVYDPDTETLYAHEHGPKGGDELNVVVPGQNYGWPIITYGVNYDGTIITNRTEKDGLEQPIEKWVPSIAPSGMALYTGDKYPGWRGDLFIGAMNGPKGLKLVRVDLEDGRMAGREDLLTEDGFGYRDVINGPDGYLYVATADLDGAVYRVEPAS